MYSHRVVLAIAPPQMEATRVATPRTLHSLRLRPPRHARPLPGMRYDLQPMRRLLRILFNAATVLSLALWTLVIGLGLTSASLDLSRWYGTGIAHLRVRRMAVEFFTCDQPEQVGDTFGVSRTSSWMGVHMRRAVCINRANRELVITIPHWLVAAIALPFPLLWAEAWRRQHRRKRGVLRGLCTHCSYDLRGNVSGICPECGMAITVKAGRDCAVADPSKWASASAPRAGMTSAPLPSDVPSGGGPERCKA
jgi:hypothetical protein